MAKEQTKKASGGWVIPQFGKKSGRTAIRAKDVNECLVAPLNALGQMALTRGETDEIVFSDGKVIIQIKRAGADEESASTSTPAELPWQITRTGPLTVQVSDGACHAVTTNMCDDTYDHPLPFILNSSGTGADITVPEGLPYYYFWLRLEWNNTTESYSDAVLGHGSDPPDDWDTFPNRQALDIQFPSETIAGYILIGQCSTEGDVNNIIQYIFDNQWLPIADRGGAWRGAWVGGGSVIYRLNDTVSNDGSIWVRIALGNGADGDEPTGVALDWQKLSDYTGP